MVSERGLMTVDLRITLRRGRGSEATGHAGRHGRCSCGRSLHIIGRVAIGLLSEDDAGEEEGELALEPSSPAGAESLSHPHLDRRTPKRGVAVCGPENPDFFAQVLAPFPDVLHELLHRTAPPTMWEGDGSSVVVGLP